ncbi:hypothetical protein AURDEDRAFT_165653 [Auricularia subglabra TFB-10046 SS5]|nr:hypothetical protein AURDEDRAFT_165653 [Auricularia subglabra TFB-10046 SS5]
MAAVDDTIDLSGEERVQDESPPASPMTLARRAIQAAIISRDAPPVFEDDLNGEDAEGHPLSQPTSPMPTTRRQKRPLPVSPQMRDLAVTAQQLAKTKKLRSESQAELHSYTQLPPLERELFRMSVGLQIRDKLTEIIESADWRLPSQLKASPLSNYHFLGLTCLQENCARYAAACVMSPMIPSYYLTFSSIVMKLLQGLDAENPGSSQLPSELNGSQSKLVVTEINSVAIKKRSELKTKIEKSLDSKDCIELLCEVLTTPQGIAPTTMADPCGQNPARTPPLSFFNTGVDFRVLALIPAFWRRFFLALLQSGALAFLIPSRHLPAFWRPRVLAFWRSFLLQPGTRYISSHAWSRVTADTMQPACSAVMHSFAPHVTPLSSSSPISALSSCPP